MMHPEDILPTLFVFAICLSPLLLVLIGHGVAWLVRWTRGR